jgi:hypothetical protein
MPAGVAVQEPSPFYNKPTFAALSQAMDDAVRSLKDHEQMETRAYDRLKDQLCLSPRLTQWTFITGSVAEGSEYRIHNIGNDKFLSVYRDKVMLTMNSNSEEYPIITDATLAATLFKSIETAQNVVQPRRKSVETDDAFFAPTSDYYQGAGLDAALEETHSDALIEEDADLVEEIVAGEQTETGEHFWNNNDKDEDEDEETVEGEEEHPIKTRHPVWEAAPEHTSKINKSAAVEGSQLKKEFPADIEERYKDNPVQDYPKTANTAVVSRLKSLQGRLLNIVEASFTDKEQRAAVKTLVNKEFRREMNNFNRGSWNGFSDEE